MAKKKTAGPIIPDNADDTPELMDESLAAATVRDGDKIVRHLRPTLPMPQ